MTTPERDYESTADVGAHPSTDSETPHLTDVESNRTTGAQGRHVDDTGAGSTLVEDSGDLFERWQRAQAGFVDAPRETVQEASAIVEDALGRLRESFDSERSRLEATWQAGDEPSTEDLRVAIQRYRTFFERLLAA